MYHKLFYAILPTMRTPPVKQAGSPVSYFILLIWGVIILMGILHL